MEPLSRDRVKEAEAGKASGDSRKSHKNEAAFELDTEGLVGALQAHKVQRRGYYLSKGTESGKALMCKE